jgi:hypothetical protein
MVACDWVKNPLLKAFYQKPTSPPALPCACREESRMGGYGMILKLIALIVNDVYRNRMAYTWALNFSY